MLFTPIGTPIPRYPGLDVLLHPVHPPCVLSPPALFKVVGLRKAMELMSSDGSGKDAPSIEID